MMKEEAYISNHLSTEFRSDLRFFAFFVANGSLFAGRPWEAKAFDLDYIPHLLRKNNVFGQLFSIFVNVWESCSVEEIARRPLHLDPTYRAQQYLMKQIDSSYEVAPKFEDWELRLKGSELKWKDCVNEFSMTLGNGKLEPELLRDIDYVPQLFGCGSTLEGIYAVFSNVLEKDESGKITNKERAYYRAAQCVKQWCITGYEVEPQFEGWEVELH